MAKCWPKQICVHRFTLGDKYYFHWNVVYFMMWSEQLIHLFVNNNRYEYWKWQTFENNLNPLKAVKNKYLILSFHDCDVKISLYSVVRNNVTRIITENFQNYQSVFGPVNMLCVLQMNIWITGDDFTKLHKEHVTVSQNRTLASDRVRDIWTGWPSYPQHRSQFL